MFCISIKASSKLKSLSILGDCFLMASHYREVGHGSNDNVITGSTEAVQGESSPTQASGALQFNLLRLGEDESPSPARRALGGWGGWGSAWWGASPPVCDNLTRFLRLYSQTIIALSRAVALRLVTFASVQDAVKKSGKALMTWGKIIENHRFHIVGRVVTWHTTLAFIAQWSATDG